MTLREDVGCLLTSDTTASSWPPPDPTQLFQLRFVLYNILFNASCTAHMGPLNCNSGANSEDPMLAAAARERTEIATSDRASLR